jgi:RimJ/RimL family protein N-acetyltransferase
LATYWVCNCPMYMRAKFCPEDAGPLADFLNDLRQNHWTLTSLAFQRQPDVIPLVRPEELIEGNLQAGRIGTFLLKRDETIIAMLQIDDRYGDGRVAIFSGAETHPAYQRRGTLWRHLGGPCLREMCNRGFERIEAITWPFNRKGIPLYKRVGFRAVPGTSLIMENYIPLILNHAETRLFFKNNDFIRTLQYQRSYGCDAVEYRGLSLFEYRWKSGEEELQVMVDWQHQRIASIHCAASLVVTA